MRDAEAVHSAARRYCAEAIPRWHEAYTRLESTGQARIARENAWDYSEVAKETFPRYQVLQAILDEAEQFVPQDFRSLEEAKSLLCAAAEVAENPFTRIEDPVQRAAIAHERRRFIDYVHSLSPSQLAAVEPLPFRRVLGREESQRRFSAMVGRWGRWYGGSVNRDRATLPPHVILQASTVEDAGLELVLHRILADHGLARVFEFPEFDAHCELDLAVARFKGSETYWTSDDADWLVQESHEDSTTVGGDWLVRELQAAIPRWKDLIYRGWDGKGAPAAVLL